MSLQHDIDILEKAEQALIDTDHEVTQRGIVYAHGLISGLLDKKREELRVINPIEWGEWDGNVRRSKCGMYAIKSIPEGYSSYKCADGYFCCLLDIRGEEFHPSEDATQNNLLFGNDEMIHAYDACEANRKRDAAAAFEELTKVYSNVTGFKP